MGSATTGLGGHDYLRLVSPFCRHHVTEKLLTTSTSFNHRPSVTLKNGGISRFPFSHLGKFQSVFKLVNHVQKIGTGFFASKTLR